MEAANRDIQDLQGAREHAKWNRASGAVYKVNDVRSKTQQDTGTCYRCNGDNHLAKECRFAQEKCHNCGKVGHIKRACKMENMGQVKTKHVKVSRGCVFKYE